MSATTTTTTLRSTLRPPLTTPNKMTQEVIVETVYTQHFTDFAVSDGIKVAEAKQRTLEHVQQHLSTIHDVQQMLGHLTVDNVRCDPSTSLSSPA